MATVRPWRIMIPAAIALVAVFTLVFFLTRGSGQNQPANVNGSQSGLLPAPNSQPVQPLGTPTGEAERNIQALSSSSPTPRPANANANTALSNSNSEAQSTPATVKGNFGSNSNRNSNQDEAPTPKPSPRVKAEEMPPAPRPSASVRPVVKPTASPGAH